MTKPRADHGFLRYHDGMLIFNPPKAPTIDPIELEKFLLWDEKMGWTAAGYRYRDLMLWRHRSQLTFEDQAKAYETLKLELHTRIEPRVHQKQALEAWIQNGKRGVVSLPTGAGKTILAVLAIEAVQRPALIVVPTIELLHQWCRTLQTFFNCEIGCLGGGKREIRPLTVSTYDSAAITAYQLGDKFGFLICDECHHLPSPSYEQIAVASIAPFRLGLSATIERPDGKEERIFELLGPQVFEGEIHEMVANVLAPYDVITVEIPMTQQETMTYENSRQIYRSFVQRHGIRVASKGGWNDFLKKASYLPGGTEALSAHREQKRIAQGASGKIDFVWTLLQRHPRERVIVFTNDNELAYKIGRDLLLPVITHRTRTSERSKFLENFKSGLLNILVTSRVLNEGVDVPEANIAIIVSGTSGVREHVQRLGRILRHRPDKKAILYELISEGTSETYVKDRRRQHSAYQGTH